MQSAADGSQCNINAAAMQHDDSPLRVFWKRDRAIVSRIARPAFLRCHRKASAAAIFLPSLGVSGEPQAMVLVGVPAFQPALTTNQAEGWGR